MKNRIVTNGMKVWLSLMVVAAVGCAFAGSWTGKGGDLDVATPLNWGITTGTMSGGDIEWTGSVKVESPTTLTCSGDFDFNRLHMGKSEPLIIDLGGHRIEATGLPPIRFESSGSSLTIKNGSFISSSTSTEERNALSLYFTDNEMIFEGNMTTGSFRSVGVGIPKPNGQGNGYRNRLIVRDGAVVEVRGGDTCIGAKNASGGNALIIDGGTFITTGIFYLGLCADSRTNEVRVVNGGLLEVNRFPNGGGNAAAISNRLYFADSKFQLHGYCRIDGFKEGSCGTRIDMKGKSQVITDGYSTNNPMMTFLYETDIYFTFPVPGESADYAAFVCDETSGRSYMQINDGVNLHFDAASVKKFAMEGGASLTLFRASFFTFGNKDATLARWTAAANEAWEGASVALSSTNKEIVLTIPKNKEGLAIIIR